MLDSFHLGLSVALPDLRATSGFLVSDVEGRVVGHVECAMYGTAPDVPDAIAVKSSSRFLGSRRRVVPADAIGEIDGSKRLIGLRVAREALKSFL